MVENDNAIPKIVNFINSTNQSRPSIIIMKLAVEILFYLSEDKICLKKLKLTKDNMIEMIDVILNFKNSGIQIYNFKS